MDKYAEIRQLSFESVLSVLRIDTSQYRFSEAKQEWVGPCPVCRPKKNRGNFRYNVDGRLHCFSCGTRGRGAIDLCKAVKECGFQAAVELLQPHTSEVAAKPAPAPAIEETPARSENPAFKATYEKYFVESDWLKARGLTAESLKRYGVGEYCNPNRTSIYRGHIMFRIQRFSDGEVVGYLSRNPKPAEGQPKYVFPKGVLKSLEVFGAVQLKNDPGQVLPRRRVFLVESPLCVMKFHQLGIPAVSCFGWSVSPEQASILSQLARGVVYLPDRNIRNEALSVAGMLSQHLWVKMPESPVDDPEYLEPDQIRALA